MPYAPHQPLVVELPPDRPDVLINSAEFARLMGISKRHLFNLRASGASLPTPIKRADNRLWWRSNEVRAFLEGQ
jgi:predicted DNA-binding transcriptional regulator AlpA